MERLTIRNSDGTVSQPTDLRWAEALEKLAHYEDLEEQGRLVELLCAPDAVFWQMHGRVPAVSRFDGFQITDAGEKRWFCGEKYFTEDDFGKTVFLTRAEAEAALAASDAKGG